jgi:hypothetical protein
MRTNVNDFNRFGKRSPLAETTRMTTINEPTSMISMACVTEVRSRLKRDFRRSQVETQNGPSPFGAMLPMRPKLLGGEAVSSERESHRCSMQHCHDELLGDESPINALPTRSLHPRHLRALPPPA